MAEAATKLPIKTEAAPQDTGTWDWRPFEALRSTEPFWHRDFDLDVTPVIDIVESEKVFEVTAELPGLDTRTSTSCSPTTC